MTPLETAAKAAYENYLERRISGIAWETEDERVKEAWRASIRAALETQDATEFVLAQINAELKDEIERLRAALGMFRIAKAFLSADDYDDGPEMRERFDMADSMAELALKEPSAPATVDPAPLTPTPRTGDKS